MLGQKIRVPKKIWVQENLGAKSFGSRKLLGQKKFWVNPIDTLTLQTPARHPSDNYQTPTRQSAKFRHIGSILLLEAR